MDLNHIINYRLIKLDAFQVTVAGVLMMALILVSTRVALSLFRRMLFRNMDNTDWDRSRRESMYLLVKYVAWTIAISMAVQAVGVKITLLLAGSAALLVGLGLGVQRIFSDIVSGIFLLFEGTVRLDDIIEVDGLVCRVKGISLRTSRVETRDGVVLIVPNHKFIDDNVINWSRQPARHARFRVKVGVSYESDPEAVREVLLQCMARQEDIVREEPNAPLVRFNDFGESALEFEMLFWSQRMFRVERLKSDLRFDVFASLKRAGITIPYPQRDLHIKELPGELRGRAADRDHGVA